jgi:hypothetical protein
MGGRGNRGKGTHVRAVRYGIATLCLIGCLPLAAHVHSSPSPPATVLPRPHVSLPQALKIASVDAKQHGALVGSAGYVSMVEYGRFQKLSSGARCTCATPKALVWAVTYTDVSLRTKAKQIISASTGQVLTRVYYAPPSH